MTNILSYSCNINFFDVHNFVSYTCTVHRNSTQVTVLYYSYLSDKPKPDLVQQDLDVTSQLLQVLQKTQHERLAAKMPQGVPLQPTDTEHKIGQRAVCVTAGPVSAPVTF